MKQLHVRALFNLYHRLYHGSVIFLGEFGTFLGKFPPEMPRLNTADCVNMIVSYDVDGLVSRTWSLGSGGSRIS